MDKQLLEQIIKDKYYDYLKDNSFFIKELYRNPNNYQLFKKYIKDKYHLKVTDKITNVLDDIDLFSSVMNTLK